jgi:hypothetical protein
MDVSCTQEPNWGAFMVKLIAAAAAVLFVCMGPTVSSAAPSMGAKPLETASSPMVQDVRYYRHHHHWRWHHYHRHHYYWHHRHHYYWHRYHHRHWHHW